MEVNIFSSAKNRAAYDKLQNMKEKLQVMQDKEKDAVRERLRNEYKKTHIFKSYEDALDYLFANPNTSIEWHSSFLRYEGQGDMITVDSVQYDYEGICCLPVTYHKTREELLEEIHKTAERIDKQFNENFGMTRFFDKDGFLEYVSL